MREHMSPRDKYMNDPEYRQLVDLLEQFVERAQFSPSEMREAVILASINYEMRNVRGAADLNPRYEEAFRTLDEMISRRQRR